MNHPAITLSFCDYLIFISTSLKKEYSLRRRKPAFRHRSKNFLKKFPNKEALKAPYFRGKIKFIIMGILVLNLKRKYPHYDIYFKKIIS